MLTEILTRVRSALQRRRVAREVDDELQFRLQMETESNIKRGMPPIEARRMALLDLGGVVRTKETIRDVRLLSVESIWQDTRYAFRGMRKKPGFTGLAVVTLALGIGVNAASLAVAYGILVRPLPYVEPSRVIILNLSSLTAATWDSRRVLSRNGCRACAPWKPPRATTGAKSPFGPATGALLSRRQS